jgi:hypothetical protein
VTDIQAEIQAERIPPKKSSTLQVYEHARQFILIFERVQVRASVEVPDIMIQIYVGFLSPYRK